MACHLVLLAAMKDEPDSRFAVGLDIARGDFLRCAVHHDIGRAKQVVETACHVETGRAHGRGAIRICREKREALRARHPGPPIGGDIGHAGHLHVILGGDRVRHPFADHAVAVHGDPDPFFICHDALLVSVADDMLPAICPASVSAI